MTAPELHIQRFLRDSGASSTEQRLASLLSRYTITAKRHLQRPNLVLLKYSQIDSPFSEPIVRECRGIILDEAEDWRVVSMAFQKFFNDGEGHAAPIDWSTTRVQEKLDGSLAVLYWYDDQWHVATSGTPDARVVVHDRSSLTLLGARHLATLEEKPAAVAATMFLDQQPRTVREFPLQSIADIVKSFEELSPLKQEGYVVVDAGFNRIKMKHPGYVALHHAKDGLSPKAFLEIARSGEVSEVLTAFPEFKPMMDDATTRLDELVAVVEADYERLRAIPEQKAFAIEAVKTRCSAALFAIRAGKCLTAQRFFAEMRIDALMKAVGMKDAPAATEAS